MLHNYGAIFANTPLLYIPQIIGINYILDILVMERIYGIPIHDIDKYAKLALI